MLQLLATEWLKLRKYRTFWVMIGLFMIILPIWNLMISNSMVKMGGGKNPPNILDSAYTFNHVWSNMGWWASLFIMFTTILTMIITTNEFTFKTNRQNLIDGWTRIQVFHAKWLFVLIIAVFTTLYVFIVGVCFGIANDDMSNFPGDLTKLFYLFILTLNYYSFGLAIAYLVKRSGIAIGLFFFYIMFVEKLVQSVFNYFTKTEYGNLMPLQASDELLPFPLMDIAKAMMQTEVSINNTTYVIVSIGWIVIYYLISRLRILKTDW